MISPPAFGGNVERTGARSPSDPAPVEAVGAQRRPEPSRQMKSALAPIETRSAERHRASPAPRYLIERDAKAGQTLQTFGRDQSCVFLEFDPALCDHGAG